MDGEDYLSDDDDDDDDDDEMFLYYRWIVNEYDWI